MHNALIILVSVAPGLVSGGVTFWYFRRLLQRIQTELQSGFQNVDLGIAEAKEVVSAATKDIKTHAEISKEEVKLVVQQSAAAVDTSVKDHIAVHTDDLALKTEVLKTHADRLRDESLQGKVSGRLPRAVARRTE